MDNKKEVYYNYFNEKILPVIIPIENDRKKTVLKVVISTLSFLIIGLVFAGMFIYNAIYAKFSPLLLPILLFLMYAFILKSIISAIIEGKEYQKRLVRDVLPLFLEPVAKFRKWPKDDTETIISSKLFGNFDTVEENFCVFGFYNNSSIRISDTMLTLPVRNSDKSYLFKGTMIKVELPQSIDNHVILSSKNLKRNNKFKQINPHIEDFNRYLYTFAKKDDKVDFINEEFWKIIKKFGQTYTAKSFAMSYKNNVVLLALQQKRPLQFGFLLKSLLKPENFDELIDRFIVIYDLIDFLVLDRNF